MQGMKDRREGRRESGKTGMKEGGKEGRKAGRKEGRVGRKTQHNSWLAQCCSRHSIKHSTETNLQYLSLAEDLCTVCHQQQPRRW